MELTNPTKSVMLLVSLVRLFLNCSFGIEVMESSLQQSAEQQMLFTVLLVVEFSLFVLQQNSSEVQQFVVEPVQ